MAESPLLTGGTPSGARPKTQLLGRRGAQSGQRILHLLQGAAPGDFWYTSAVRINLSFWYPTIPFEFPHRPQTWNPLSRTPFWRKLASSQSCLREQGTASIFLGFPLESWLLIEFGSGLVMLKQMLFESLMNVFLNCGGQAGFLIAYLAATRPSPQTKNRRKKRKEHIKSNSLFWPGKINDVSTAII